MEDLPTDPPKGITVRLISAGCLLALVGCSTEAGEFGRCSNITVTVSHEATPEFAWAPADCAMHEFNVTEDQQVQWLIASNDNDNRLSSPVRYGQDPLGTSGSQATPLHTGFFYTVDLWRFDEQGMLRRLVSQRFLHQVE